MAQDQEQLVEKYSELLATHLRQNGMGELADLRRNKQYEAVAKLKSKLACTVRRTVHEMAIDLVKQGATAELPGLFQAVRTYMPLKTFSNNKSRMGDVYRILKIITKDLVQRGNPVQLRALFEVCVDFDFYERWRPHVLCCLIRGLRQVDPDYSETAWSRSLSIFQQLHHLYDFWSAIPAILQLADDCNWLDGKLANDFRTMIESAVAESEYGWKDWHLVDCQEWMAKLENRA